MLEKDIYPLIASELKAQPHQVEAAAKLLDEGNTVPFIARYRKEATGSLEDEQLRELEERLAYLRGLVKRQEEVLAKIEEQGKLTDELRQSIEKTRKLQELEDLYLPYKQKKRTRAQIARERGLEPLEPHAARQRPAGQSGGDRGHLLRGRQGGQNCRGRPAGRAGHRRRDRHGGGEGPPVHARAHRADGQPADGACKRRP